MGKAVAAIMAGGSKIQLDKVDSELNWRILPARNKSKLKID